MSGKLTKQNLVKTLVDDFLAKYPDSSRAEQKELSMRLTGFKYHQLYLLVHRTDAPAPVPAPVVSRRVKCDQCNPSVLNNVPCHERGCPNDRLEWITRWDLDEGELTDLDAPDHWSSPAGCHEECPACEELSVLVPDTRDRSTEEE